MQAGRQAYGLAGRRLFTGENDVFASMSVSWPQFWLISTDAKCIHDIARHGVLSTELDYYACSAAVVLA